MALKRMHYFQVIRNDTNEDEDETRIYYGQEKTYTFDEATSCDTCKPTDKLNFINAPLIGIS